MSDNATELLTHFFGAYFHQDWRLDAENWPAVVEFFRAHTPASEVASTAIALRELLARIESEAELEKVLYRDLGCYYTPRPDIGGLSFRAWLGQVREALES